MMRVTVEVRPELGIGARNRQPQAEGDRRFKLVLTKLCKKLPLVFYYINSDSARLGRGGSIVMQLTGTP